MKFRLNLFAIIGLLSFPLYILLNSLFYSLFIGLVYHEWKFDLLLFGFPCEVPKTIESITFFSIFIGLRLLLYFLGVLFFRSLLRSNIGHFILFGIGALWLYDAYSILAYLTDGVLTSYFRFFFYPSTPLYKLGSALQLPLLVVPVINVVAGMYFIMRFLKFLSIKKIVLFFVTTFASLIIFGALLKYALKVSILGI